MYTFSYSECSGGGGGVRTSLLSSSSSSSSFIIWWLVTQMLLSVFIVSSASIENQSLVGEPIPDFREYLLSLVHHVCPIELVSDWGYYSSRRFTLNCSHMQWKEPPPLSNLSTNCAGVCLSMINLDLSNNRISSISEEYLKANNLQILHVQHLTVSYNGLEELPNLWFMPELHILNVSFNFMRSFRVHQFTSMQELHTLDARNNLLQTLPEDIFSNNKKLTTVLLDNNWLTRFQFLTSLPNNAIVSIAFNPVSISQTRRTLAKSKQLSIRPQPLDQFISDLWNRSVQSKPQNGTEGCIVYPNSDLFSCTNKSLREIPTELLTGQTHLRTLMLDLNCLSSLNDLPVQRGSLQFVRKLNLASNQLSEVPPLNVLSALHQLQNLDLGYNNITRVSNNAFTSMLYLQVLKLNNNPLAFIETNAFADTNNLNVLHLHDCQLLSADFLPPLIRILNASTSIQSKELELSVQDNPKNTLSEIYKIALNVNKAYDENDNSKVRIRQQIIWYDPYANKRNYLCENTGTELIINPIPLKTQENVWPAIHDQLERLESNQDTPTTTTLSSGYVPLINIGDHQYRGASILLDQTSVENSLWTPFKTKTVPYNSEKEEAVKALKTHEKPFAPTKTTSDLNEKSSSSSVIAKLNSSNDVNNNNLSERKLDDDTNRLRVKRTPSFSLWEKISMLTITLFSLFWSLIGAIFVLYRSYVKWSVKKRAREYTRTQLRNLMQKPAVSSTITLEDRLGYTTRMNKDGKLNRVGVNV